MTRNLRSPSRPPVTIRMASGTNNPRSDRMALSAIHAGPPLASRFDAFAIVEDYARIARERGGRVPGVVAPLLLLE